MSRPTTEMSVIRSDNLAVSYSGHPLTGTDSKYETRVSVIIFGITSKNGGCRMASILQDLVNIN